MAYINVADNNLSAGYSGANFNEMFLQPVFTDEDIMSNYRVVPNVRHTMNLYTADPLSCVVQDYSGCDDTEYVGKDFNLNQRTITAGRMRVALEQCQDEFFGTYIEESYKAGLDVFNLTGTDLMNTIMANVKQSITNDLVKLAWFGDTSAEETSECYNSTDGFLHHMLDGTTGVTPVAWANGALGADDAIGQIRLVIEGADGALNAMAGNEKCIWVSPNVFWNFVTSCEGVGSDMAYSAMVDGKPIYYFRGVEVRPMYSFETGLANANAWSGEDQLIVYGAKKNFVIGTDTNDPSNQLKFWYDEYREKMIIRSYFKFGTQFAHQSLISWSYRNSS